MANTGTGTAGQVYTSNGPGISPSFQAAGGSTAPIGYVSPSINFKVVGLTTIFTTEATKNFYPISLIFICDTATSANGDSAVSIGWTAAAYTDLYTSGFPLVVASQAQNNNSINNPFDFFPNNTAIRVNVSSAETGTALTGRVLIVGFYA